MRIPRSRAFDKVSPMMRKWLKGITGKQLEVWLWLVENRIYATGRVEAHQADIARELGTHQPVICKAMAELSRRNLVRRVINGIYIINPEAVYRGDDRDFVRLSRMFADAKPLSQKKAPSVVPNASDVLESEPAQEDGVARHVGGV